MRSSERSRAGATALDSAASPAGQPSSATARIWGCAPMPESLQNSGATPGMFRIEATLAVLTGALGVVTAVSSEWIEVATGWDPDRHSGSLEWAVVTGLLLASLSLALLARHEWRLVRYAS